jgi:cytochrome c biogenesis protein CcdA/thiol-disulfide isomerase/thioredoxin
MTLFLISLLAGALTVLSPCVLPLLPVIVGGSLAGGTSLRRALVVTASLGVSVFLFTILLKVSTAFINVPSSFWTIFSGVLIILVGLVMVFPKAWDAIPFVAKMNANSSKAMNTGFMKKSVGGDILVGAALGPVFSTCSPTYFIVLATVLPVSLAAGLGDILAYIIGLCAGLLLVAFVGQRVMEKLNIASNPNGWFKRAIGVLFVLIGILIISGLDKVIEAPLYSIFDETKIEQSLLAKKQASGLQIGAGSNTTTSTDGSGTMSATSTDGANQSVPSAAPASTDPAIIAAIARKASLYPRAPELVSPDAYLNTAGAPISLAGYRGKNVVLLDFWTYSCINCQRTLPYLTSWYSKYKDQGLVVIGVHTPEFAFEHVKSNVADALVRFGIKYPVVLDNEYKTWNAYQNQFWPHEYVIDIDGFVTHDHSGEGEYDVTEKAIQAALAERAARLGMPTTGITKSVTVVPGSIVENVGSPETYFGSNRNVYLGNGVQAKNGTANFMLPGTPIPNMLYLGGSWNIASEYATTNDANETIEYTYNSQNLYFVASADSNVTIQVLQDGAPVGSAAGADVSPTTSIATISGDRLYTLVHNATSGPHTIKILIHGAGFHAYTFTFG